MLLSHLKFWNESFYFLVEYDIPIFEKFGKGGTYPRRYHISYHQQDYNDGKYEHCNSFISLFFSSENVDKIVRS